ncbi:MAG: sigma-70 family RNA polymerase sigma factor [Cytophagales bacterium]|nr:sigma-70 family RNA polymerase sigma factor [Cytophagales bacterium]
MSEKELEHFLIRISGKLYGMIRRYVPPEDAEDVLQEVSVKIWLKRKTLDQVDNLEAYCWQTGRNESLKRLAKKKRLNNLEEALELASLSTASSPVEYSETKHLLFKCMETLPARQREILLLKSIDGLDNAQIALTTGLTAEHIRVVLSRARKKMKKALDQYYAYESQGKRTAL